MHLSVSSKASIAPTLVNRNGLKTEAVFGISPFIFAFTEYSPDNRCIPTDLLFETVALFGTQSRVCRLLNGLQILLSGYHIHFLRSVEKWRTKTHSGVLGEVRTRGHYLPCILQSPCHVVLCGSPSVIFYFSSWIPWNNLSWLQCLTPMTIQGHFPCSLCSNSPLFSSFPIIILDFTWQCGYLFYFSLPWTLPVCSLFLMDKNMNFLRYICLISIFPVFGASVIVPILQSWFIVQPKMFFLSARTEHQALCWNFPVTFHSPYISVRIIHHAVRNLAAFLDYLLLSAISISPFYSYELGHVCIGILI